MRSRQGAVLEIFRRAQVFPERCGGQLDAVV